MSPTDCSITLDGCDATVYLLHASIVDEAGVRGGAGDDEARTEEPSCHLQLIIVNEPRGWL